MCVGTSNPLTHQILLSKQFTKELYHSLAIYTGIYIHTCMHTYKYYIYFFPISISVLRRTSGHIPYSIFSSKMSCIFWTTSQHSHLPVIFTRTLSPSKMVEAISIPHDYFAVEYLRDQLACLVAVFADS